MKIVIVDYGMGNIRSIFGALTYLGINEISVSADYTELQKADKIILPGVGSFAKAMISIVERNIDFYLQELIQHKKKPILGICLGMQLLGLSSTEEGENKGLGFIKGEVNKLKNSMVKVPHVGFNQVRKNYNSRLYYGLADNLDFYFTHSYKMESNAHINQSICNYGEDFIASYELENIAGVQFHPELSQHNGLNLLKNFIEKF